MKKYLRLLIIPLLLLPLFTNVYAEGDNTETGGENTETGGETTPAWPKEFQTTDSNFQYIIEGISLDIYQNDKDSEKITTEYNTDTTHSTITYTKDEENYINKVKIKTIELSPSEYSISPVYKKDTYLLMPEVLYIDINLNLTKEKIESLVTEQIENTTDRKSYIIDVTVKYQLKNYPEKYGYGYRIDYMREFMSIGIEHTVPTLAKNTTYSQVLNRAVTKFNEETNQKSLDYSQNFNEDNLILISDLSMLSETAIDNKIVLNEDEAQESYSKTIGIMFHDTNNIDELINYSKEAINSDDNDSHIPTNPITSNQPLEIVKAEDTALSPSMYIYIVGGLLLIVGLGLFGKVLFKKDILN